MESKTEVRAALDIWSTLALIGLIFHANLKDKDADEEDIIGAQEYRARMARINVCVFKYSH
jgi:hypothetical protein